jgi:hypothetical protein
MRRMTTLNNTLSILPIFLSEYRKVDIIDGRVGNVANVEENMFEVSTSPIVVELSNNCRCINMIPVMKVMVIVEAISKVKTWILVGWAVREDIVTSFTIEQAATID